VRRITGPERPWGGRGRAGGSGDDDGVLDLDGDGAEDGLVVVLEGVGVEFAGNDLAILIGPAVGALLIGGLAMLVCDEEAFAARDGNDAAEGAVAIVCHRVRVRVPPMGQRDCRNEHVEGYERDLEIGTAGDEGCVIEKRDIHGPANIGGDLAGAVLIDAEDFVGFVIGNPDAALRIDSDATKAAGALDDDDAAAAETSGSGAGAAAAKAGIDEEAVEFALVALGSVEDGVAGLVGDGDAVAIIHGDAEEEVREVAIVDVDGFPVGEVDAILVVDGDGLGLAIREDSLCGVLVIGDAQVDLANLAGVGHAAVL